MKKRIMMLTESGHIMSGFGNYTRNVLSRLHNTGKYEIAELSCYRDKNVPKTEAWKVYPNVPTGEESEKKYRGITSSVFGAWGFETACLDFKPDIVFDIRDYWMLNFPEYSPFRPFFHWVLAPTIDSAPQRKEWLQTYSNADLVSGHTQWGIDYLKQFSNINTTFPVNDSVDVNNFKPVSIDKKAHKANHFLDPNDFIVGSVMRNQKRKLIPNLIKVIKQLNKKYPRIKLHLHTSYPDNAGWPIPELMLEHDAADIVYFTYKCAHCGKYSVMSFKEGLAICPHCKNQSANICNVSQGLNDSELCSVYNLFDTYVQYAICEGFGIPPVEAAACGLSLITVDHGAMREIGDNLNGRIVKLASTFRELETNAERVSPDDEDLYNQIEQEYLKQEQQSWLQSLKSIEENRNTLLENYSWDKTAKDYEKMFDNIELTGLQGKWDSPPQPISEDTNVDTQNVRSNRELIDKVVCEIIKSPYLLRTAMVQTAIRNLDAGFVNDGGTIKPYTMKEASGFLDQLYNSKKTWDAIRTGSMELPDQFKEIIEY
tara:strand:- start:26107 stop:27732 length:1626 start_codon:yes stop_codon:yes gene_type:complete